MEGVGGAVRAADACWARTPAGQRSPLRITPVLPILFHTGNTPWQTSRELSDLMTGPEALRRLAPHWPLFLWDLAARSPRELLSQASEWLRALAVVRAERADRDEFQAIYREALQGLEALSKQEHMRWSDLVHFIISWATRRRPREEAQTLRQLAVESQTSQRGRKEIQTMSKTIAEVLEEQGELAACRENLIIVLEERFGKLPARLVKRINSYADLAKLKAAFRQSLRIESLDELEI